MFYYYWAHLRAERGIMSLQQNGGGGVMIWGCFSYRGRLKVIVCECNLNATEHINILERWLLHFLDSYHPEGGIFMHDGADSHRALTTVQYLKDVNVDVMQWPARSPDLSPIENIWSQ